MNTGKKSTNPYKAQSQRLSKATGNPYRARARKAAKPLPAEQLAIPEPAPSVPEIRAAAVEPARTPRLLMGLDVLTVEQRNCEGAEQLRAQTKRDPERSQLLAAAAAKWARVRQVQAERLPYHPGSLLQARAAAAAELRREGLWP